jgi:hypothetical protein
MAWFVEPFTGIDIVTEDRGPDSGVSGGGRPRAWPMFAGK